MDRLATIFLGIGAILLLALDFRIKKTERRFPDDWYRREEEKP